MTTDPSSPSPAISHGSGADGGLFAPELRALTVGLLLTVTLVAFESLAVATVMPEVKDDLGGLGLYGWVFSAFFLASLLGIGISGQVADRRGLRLPYLIGLVVFALGLLVGAEAQSMPMLIVGRVCQGFGAGAIPSMAYTAIGRGMPARLRPRMFAALSTAWVVPGLVGPGIATFVEHAASWRWVFGGLLPLVALAGFLTTPALRALDGANPVDSREPFDRRRIGLVMMLVLGVGMALATGDIDSGWAPLLAAVGVPLAVWAFVVVQPKGTARLAPGVPATVAVRGVLTWAFFSGDAYVSLALHDGRGAPTWVAGLALSAGAVFWTGGSWFQARNFERMGPRNLVGLGSLILMIGIAAMLLVNQGLPIALAVISWGVAAFGMGMAYAPLSVTVLGAAKAGEEGAASAALQLSDTLGMAVGTGLGGTIVTVGDARVWTVTTSTSMVFAMAAAMAVLAVLASRRLPAEVPAAAD